MEIEKTKTNNPPIKIIKEHKTYEVRVYLLVSSYSEELELLTIILRQCHDVTARGRVVSLAKTTIEEYVRNIGLFGITIEDPKNTFSYYPPHRIGKVEYSEVGQTDIND